MFCIAKSHTKFRVRLKNFKSVHKSIKTNKQEHKNNFTIVIYDYEWT